LLCTDVRRIAGTLQIRVSRAEEHRALAQAPKTLDVYVLTARGKAMMLHYDADGLRQARQFFAQALAIDPDYAPAWAHLGTADMIDIGLHLTGEWDRSRASEMPSNLQRAIALDPQLPNAYIALSQAQGLLGNVDAALAAAERCRQISPNESGCFASLAMEQLRIGRANAAVRSFEQALELDPVPPPTCWRSTRPRCGRAGGRRTRFASTTTVWRARPISGVAGRTVSRPSSNWDALPRRAMKQRVCNSGSPT